MRRISVVATRQSPTLVQVVRFHHPQPIIKNERGEPEGINRKTKTVL